MGVSSPTMSRSARDVTPGSLRRNTSSRAASPTESLSEEMSGNEAGNLQRVATDNAGQAAIIMRKKLPWLDTATTRPGVTATKAQPIANPPKNTPKILPTSTDRQRPAYHNVSNSQQQIRPKQIESSYVSSDYSAGTLSDADTLPTNLPRKDPASYEKLVDTVFEPGGRTPVLHPGARRAAKTELNTSRKVSTRAETVSDDMGDGTKTLKPNPSPYRNMPKPQVDETRPRRCKSCETEAPSDDGSSPRALRHTNQDIAAVERRFSPRSHADRTKPASRPVLLPATSSSSSHVDADSGVQRKQSQTEAVDVSRSSGSLNRAVTGLENLMEEALNVARDAVKTGRSEAVAGVLNDATMALRQANSVQSNMHERRSLTTYDSQHVSESDSESDSSHRRGHKVSAETLPTVYTKSTKSRQQIRANDRHSQPSFQGGRNARRDRAAYSDDNSISHTPPRLYQPASAESIVRDFAYNEQKSRRKPSLRTPYGAAASFYHDQGESIALQPGVRQSIPGYDKLLPALPAQAYQPAQPAASHHPAFLNSGKHERVHRAHQSRRDNTDRIVLAAQESDVDPLAQRPIQRKGTGPLPALPAELRHKLDQRQEDHAPAEHPHHAHRPSFMQSSYYRNDEKPSLSREAQWEQSPNSEEPVGKPTSNAVCRVADIACRHHLSLREGEKFSLAKHHKRQPIAPLIACLNTIFIGLIAGIYAGEVPRIQYQLADQSHWVNFGNMLLFFSLGLATLIFWPLPLLHGRRPYTLLALGLMLPLHLPQALTVAS
ncbi:uncharacterized protein CLAFUR5_04431 [Fulvia fulva]|uniref:Uncharacterized protein n=1 Tax=Passalora fulva TaxID=5499 RepID=A0A9Q8P8F0_PASFU|nr:uncharacterized protein CLAFUR5_04431 [Fulvia fulva]UJO17160.1 hypothetical protein CLAFUR5_04431 [Fulvia fulva]WPV28808.1 hypothetical protein CLAFUW7_04458 [Fulvia fulva]